MEPSKISELTQDQRNALIAALGCKTVYPMINGESLPLDFLPDEIHLRLYNVDINNPPPIAAISGYIPLWGVATQISGDNVTFDLISDSWEPILSFYLSSSERGVSVASSPSQQNTTSYLINNTTFGLAESIFDLKITFVKVG